MKTVVPNVSLIIPVYNVEQYLPKCLESIAAQTLKGFEVILVDDGSTDHSLEILRGFARRFPNTCVIHQENGGVSKARNAGIQAARGKYIAFMDSDDYIAPLYLQRLYESAKKYRADMVCCSYYRYNAVTHELRPAQFRKAPGIYTPKEMIRALILDMGIKGFSWNKLWRRTLFTEHHITFPTMCFEDISVCQRGFYFSNRIAVIGDPLYFYVQHKDSAIGALNIKKLNDYLRALADLRGFLELQRDFPPYRAVYRLHSLFVAITTCYLTLVAQKNAKNLSGLGRNFKEIIHMTRACGKKSFEPLDDITKYPDVIFDKKCQHYGLEDSSIE